MNRSRAFLDTRSLRQVQVVQDAQFLLVTQIRSLGSSFRARRQLYLPENAGPSLILGPHQRMMGSGANGNIG